MKCGFVTNRNISNFLKFLLLISYLFSFTSEAIYTCIYRSSHQMNIILRLVKEYFPDIVIEEDVNPIRAAMTLMEELKLYLQDASTATRQMARIKTDLLIP